MGAGHDHGSSASIRHEKPLWWALGLIAGFMLVEVIAALASNSLALLSDAAHMATDALALTIALVAVRLGRRPPDAKRSFGYVRTEAIGALANGLLLFGVSGWILWEAVRRFAAPPDVASMTMLVVGILGLIVNLIAMHLLKAGSGESLNMKGAYLEVWADALGSVGVIAAALVIHFTGWRVIDTLVAAAIGLWVLPRAWLLVRQAVHILMMGVPEGIDLGEVRNALLGIDGVTDVHDLHVWALDSQQAAMTAHLVVDPERDDALVRHQAAQRLHDTFAIERVTLQIERQACEAPDCSHPLDSPLHERHPAHHSH